MLMKKKQNLPLPCPILGGAILGVIELSNEPSRNHNQMITRNMDGRRDLPQL